MLERSFLEICNMTLTGSCVIVVILAARLLMRRLPRVYSYALWAVAALRLLCPFSFESARALIPVKAEPFTPELFYAETPQIDSGITILDQAVNASLPAATTVEASVNPAQIAIFVAALVWLAGLLAVVAYNVVALLRLYRRLGDAEMIGNGCFVSARIDTPFVLGFVRPRIYLPAALDAEARELILLHERAHIRRRDHLAKLLGFAVLAVHWFNPLVWLAFRCFERDMEMACDEAVMRGLDEDRRADYSTLLLNLATGRRLAAPHLAFGESDTGARIKHVLRYRKPAVWVSAIALIVVIVLCGCMLFSRANDEPGEVLFTADTLTGMRFVDGINEASALDLDLTDVTLSQVENEACLRFTCGGEEIALYAVPISSDVRGRGWADTFVLAPTLLRGSDRFTIARVALDVETLATSLMDVNASLAGQTVLSIQLWETATGDMLYWQGAVEVVGGGEPRMIMRELTAQCVADRTAEELAALIEAAPLWIEAKTPTHLSEVGIVAEEIAVPDAVLGAAVAQVTQQFEKDSATLPYVKWRLNGIALDYTYDETNQALAGLEIYRYSFDFYSETPDDIMMAGGMVKRGDGWIGVHYLNCHFVVYDPTAGEAICTFFINDSEPGQERFAVELQRQLAAYGWERAPVPGYVMHQLTFPAYEQQEGLHPSWYIDPFVFSIPLPDGWTVVEASDEEKATINGNGTPLYFYDGDTQMGSVKFRTATWVEGGEGSSYMYFQGYVLGSIINWGIDLQMVYDTGSSGVATSKLAVNQMDGVAAAASTIKYYPAILAYLRDGDTILQVALSFAEGAFDDETLTAIAEKITLAKK